MHRHRIASLLAAVACALPCRAGDKERADTPEQAWQQFQEAVRRADPERTWALLSADSRKAVEQLGEELSRLEGRERAEKAEELGITEEQFAKMTARELILAQLFASVRKDEEGELASFRVKDVVVEGDRARGVRVEGDERRPAYFAKEDGEWKLDVARELAEDEAEETPAPEAPK